MSEMSEIIKAEMSDLSQLVEVMIEAFWDDPEMNFLCRGDRKKREAFFLSFRNIFLKSMFHSQVFTTEDKKAVACWVPPLQKQKSTWRSQTHLRDMLKSVEKTTIQKNILRLKYLLRRNIPSDRYYLSTLAVSPSSQGKGMGSKILEPMLNFCDQENIPAYLNTSKEINLKFYKKHSFEVVKEYRVNKDLNIWFMERPPTSTT